MADNQQLIDKLVSLAQLDIDATHAYTSAIDRIDLMDVKQQLTLFRGDHERHISNLSPMIEQLGGQAPTRSPDLKGFFIQGMTAVRSMFGNEAALKAMKGNEELTNKKYSEALELDFPVDIKNVIQGNLDDERRHLEYVNRCISEKVWDRAEKKIA
jgi:uncharacterized protein (TIGR02284 family)